MVYIMGCIMVYNTMVCTNNDVKIRGRPSRCFVCLWKGIEHLTMLTCVIQGACYHSMAFLHRQSFKIEPKNAMYFCFKAYDLYQKIQSCIFDELWGLIVPKCRSERPESPSSLEMSRNEPKRSKKSEIPPQQRSKLGGGGFSPRCVCGVYAVCMNHCVCWAFDDTVDRCIRRRHEWSLCATPDSHTKARGCIWKRSAHAHCSQSSAALPSHGAVGEPSLRVAH